MKTLTVRQVPDEVHEALRLKAAQKGRSVEEHVRQLLAEDAAKRFRAGSKAEALKSLQDYVRNLYGDAAPKGVVDEFLAERREEARREYEKDAR
jgi:plasmid stability protein